jgi:hypothetical protein
MGNNIKRGSKLDKIFYVINLIDGVIGIFGVTSGIFTANILLFTLGAIGVICSILYLALN